jgi:hypothetical protein
MLIQPFLCTLSAFASSFQSHRAKLSPPTSLTKDLCGISELLSLLPDEILLCSPHLSDIGWWGDASTSFEIGVVICYFWAVWHWAPGFLVGPHCAFNIGWAEAMAMELELRLALHQGLLAAEGPHNQSFLVCSDNAVIVAVTIKGHSCSTATNAVLKQIFALQAQHSVRTQNMFPVAKTLWMLFPMATW